MPSDTCRLTHASERLPVWRLMGGAMTSGGATPATSAPASTAQISEAQARENANRFLAGYLPGATVGDVDVFYGYYQFDVLRGGRRVGMLSVNDQTGQVWYHTWHGEFLEKREIGQ